MIKLNKAKKFLTLSFVVLSILILQSCVGSSENDDKVEYNPDIATSNNPSVNPLTCDEKGGCWDDCYNCAIKDECKTQKETCDNDSTCNTLLECVTACPGDGWNTCHDLCVVEHGKGNQNFLNVWNCTYCDACQDSCSEQGFNCDTYANYTPDTTTPAYPYWHDANLTWYKSYPEPNSVECIEYSGCDYLGYFSFFINEKKPESWVQANNIVAVHSNDYSKYKGKTLRIKSEDGSASIDALVYDMCADSDCNDCCTNNIEETGFLIDLEINTYERFMLNSNSEWINTVKWACLDCD